jgi:hypothetical protein
MTATTAYCIPTAEQAKYLTVAVYSSAIARVGIVIDNDDIPHLLVIFNSNENQVYRYIFEDQGAARYWHELMSDDDAKSATSWGQLFNRALKHGDIEPIAN